MKLAIIILSGDTPEILFRCLASLKENVKVEYRIYLAYNGRDAGIEAQIRSYLETHFRSEQYKVVKYDFYNFAALNNDIVRNHLDPEYGLLLFCNNDVIVHGDTVNRMVRLMLSNPALFGTVGCRLLDQDGKVQHDGQYLSTWKDGTLRNVGHINAGQDAHKLKFPDKQVIGNTFALCLSTLETFKEVGGLNKNYKKCFEDLEYNLCCLISGRINVILDSNYFSYHLESYSRKDADGVTRNDREDMRSLILFVNQRILIGAPLIYRTNDERPTN